MKRQSLWAAAAVAALSLSFAVAPCFAQAQGAQGGARQGRGNRGGGGRRGRGPLRLLAIPEVQKELSLQQAQIDLLQALGNQPRPQGQDFRSLSPEERAKRGEEMRKDQEKKVAEILDAKQVTRLKQLELQQEGIRAIARPDVADSLKLTPDQRTKSQAAIKAERDETGKLFAGFRGGAGGAGGGTRPTPEQMAATRQKMDDMRKGLETQLDALLTPAQKKQFTTMQGAPFKFPERQAGGAGGRRGNRPAAGTPAPAKPAAKA